MSALTKTQETDLANPLMRVRCVICYEEVAMTGDREHFQSLLEYQGWHLSHRPTRPKCVKKKAREALDKL